MINQQQLKNIESGIGLGILRFGMNRDKVKQLLGTPDEITRDAILEVENEAWHYDELDLSLNFDQEENWRLGTISVTNEFYVLENKKVIGLRKDDLIDFLDQLEIDDLELEDLSNEHSPNHVLISSDEMMLNFWLDNDVVSEVQWSPLFFDEETIDWPEEV